MEETGWRQFLKTGSVKDYLSYKGCIDETDSSQMTAGYKGDTSGESDNSDRYGADIDTYR